MDIFKRRPREAPPSVVGLGEVVQINVAFLAAGVTGYLGCILWRIERQPLPNYVLASFLLLAFVMLGLSGLRGVIDAARRQAAMNAFFHENDGQHSARFLTREELAHYGCLDGRRLIGRLATGEALYEPTRHVQMSHNIVVSANGGGKTSCAVVPTIMSLAHQMSRGLLLSAMVMDVKDGELYVQCAPMLKALGIETAVVDDVDQFPGDANVVGINPLSGLVRTYQANPRGFDMGVDNVCHTLRPSPSHDERNEYFRREPRKRLSVVMRQLAQVDLDLLHPGAIWAVLNDPETWQKCLELAAEDGDEALRGDAAKVLQYMAAKQEHEPSHVGDALAALAPFAAGGWLHECGARRPGKRMMAHHELMERPMMLFIVCRSDNLKRLGPYLGLHLQSALQAQMSMPRFEVHYICEEAANSPVKEMTSNMMLLRGRGARIGIVTQSQSALEVAYGSKETRIIFNEAIAKQFLRFTDFEEAERVSKAIGQKIVIRPSVSFGAKGRDLGEQFSVTRQPVITAEELMSLPFDEQIIHFGSIGWVRAKKVHQSEIGPYARLLGRNPVENTEPRVDIKVNLDG